MPEQDQLEPDDDRPQAPGTGLPDAPFRTTVWGYERRAVDAYVRRARRVMADTLSRQPPDDAVREAFERVGEETAGVLQRAHEVADEITAKAQAAADELRERSQAEAEALTATSEAEAEHRLSAAESEAAAMRRSAEQRVAALDLEIEKLWQERQRMLDDLERISTELRAVVAAADDRFPPDDDSRGEPEAHEKPTLEHPAGHAAGSPVTDTSESPEPHDVESPETDTSDSPDVVGDNPGAVRAPATNTENHRAN